MRDPAFSLGQRLSAGLLECLILQHAPTIALLWPTPQSMLDDGDSAMRHVLLNLLRESASGAGPLLHRAVMNAMNEAAELISGFANHAVYGEALLELLTTRDISGHGADVIDLARARRARERYLPPDVAGPFSQLIELLPNGKRLLPSSSGFERDDDFPAA